MPLEVMAVEMMSDSRRISIDSDNISQTMKFMIQGNFMDDAPLTGDIWVQNDDAKVMAMIYATFPWFREFPTENGGFGLLLLSGAEVTPTSDPNIWIVELTYDIPDLLSSPIGQDQYNQLAKQYNLGPGGGENNGNDWSNEFTQLSFNSTAETRHITTSRALVEGSVSTALAAKGVTWPANTPVGKPCAIGLTNEEIEGTDIYDRDFKFQITQYFPPSKLKYRYVRRIYRMTATLNDATFFGFPKGSVLFLGASGSGNVVENVPVTFEFAVKPNFKFIQTATVLSDPKQDDPALMYDQLGDAGFPVTTENPLGLGAGIHSGWSIVDYRYLPIADDNAKVKVQVPSFRLIHQPYEFTDFDDLDL